MLNVVPRTDWSHGKSQFSGFETMTQEVHIRYKARVDDSCPSPHEKYTGQACVPFDTSVPSSFCLLEQMRQ